MKTDAANEMVILHCGNRTPLGTRAGTTASGFRSRFSGIKLSRDFEDDAWQPIRIGEVECLDEGLDHTDQIANLALPALTETLEYFTDPTTKPAEITVITGLSEPRPGLAHDLEQKLTQALDKLSTQFRLFLRFEYISQGHASVITALERSRDNLTRQPFCIVGGVDSYLDADTLEWLEKDVKRLKCSSNQDGFIPGQAAGYCLLANKEAVLRQRLYPLATILDYTIGEEKNDFASGNHSTGLALAASIRKVLESLPPDTPIDQQYATLNGESYYAQEFAYCLLNTADKLGTFNSCIAPFSNFGDLGAASVPTLINLATQAGKKGYAKGPFNLITAASLGKSRGCVLLKLNSSNDNHYKLDSFSS